MFDFEGIYPSKNGVNKIAYYIWYPETKNPQGIVQLVHGMCEHSGRYDDFARFLTNNGYIVCQNDNLGHGKSSDGVFGYMGETNGDVHLVDDVYKLTSIMKEKFPTEKYFLLGHSMGSFIARRYCEIYGKELSGAIFSGTGGGGVTYTMVLYLVKLLILLKGAKYSGDYLNKINLKKYNKKIYPVNTGNEWLSRDENVWKQFSNDKYCTFSFTLGGYRDLLKLINHVSKNKWVQSINNSLPIFLFSGLCDPVGDYGRGVLKVYERLIKTGNEHIFIKLYEDGRHEMLNELNKQEVYEDVLYFLKGDWQALQNRCFQQ